MTYVYSGVGGRLGSSSAQIECSNENSGQHTAIEGASHARRATGPAETAGSRMVGVEQIGSDGIPELFSLFRAKRSSRKVLNV